MEVDDVAAEFGTDLDRGLHLTRAEAILTEHGPNQITAASGGGTLRVTHVLRGKRRDVATVSAAGQFNACEGSPNLQPYQGKTVCVFLVGKAGQLTVHHGASGIHPLPFKGRLPLGALAAIVQGNGKLTGKQLTALVQSQGLDILTWVGAQHRAAVGNKGDQAVRRHHLERLA